MSTISNIAMKVLPDRLFHSLRMLKKPDSYVPLTNVTYNQDGLVTVHNCDFMKDEAFQQAYQAGESLDSWFNCQVHWRIHTILWAAKRAENMEGDFVECGVNKGGFSRTIIEYINFENLKNKKFYLLDTFQGLSDKFISEEEKKHGFNVGRFGYKECYEEVKQTFSKFKNVEIIRGTIPDTLPQVKAEKVCYLSVDMNCAAPEIAAAEYFWDKLVSGAAIVLDDYGWDGHIVQKRAMDEFAKQKGVSVLSLPTAQGLIIKP
jgi:hypothetical protein